MQRLLLYFNFLVVVKHPDKKNHPSGERIWYAALGYSPSTQQQEPETAGHITSTVWSRQSRAYMSLLLSLLFLPSDSPGPRLREWWYCPQWAVFSLPLIKIKLPWHAHWSRPFFMETLSLPRWSQAVSSWQWKLWLVPLLIPTSTCNHTSFP